MRLRRFARQFSEANILKRDQRAKSTRRGYENGSIRSGDPKEFEADMIRN